MEIPEHGIAGPKHRRVARGVEPVEECRQPDPSGHGVELRHGEAVVGQKEVGAQGIGEDPAVPRIARTLDQRGGLAPVKITGHPGRQQGLVAQKVFPRRRAEIERFQRLVEFEAGGSNGLELRHFLRAERPCLRRELPRLRLEEGLGRHGGLEGFVGQPGH